MTDQANKTPTVEPKPVTTPEPGNVAPVDPPKAPANPTDVVDPAKVA